MATVSPNSDFDSKGFHKNLTGRANYNGERFGRKKDTLELISREYYSELNLLF